MLLPFLGFLYHLTGMARLVDLHVAADFHHVKNGNVFRNADDNIKTGVHAFHDRVSGESRRDVDNGGSGSRRRNGVLDGIKDRHTLDSLPCLAGRHAADDLGAIVQHLPCMEGRLLAGNTLHNDLCILIHEYTHIYITSCLCFIDQTNYFLGALFHCRSHDDILDRRILQNLTAKFDVGTLKTDDDRHRD